MLTYISIKNIILGMAKIAIIEYTLLEANN